jgi:hypothetical protein
MHTFSKISNQDPSSSRYMPNMGYECNKTPYMQVGHRSSPRFASTLHNISGLSCAWPFRGGIIKQQNWSVGCCIVTANGHIISPELPFRFGCECSNGQFATRRVPPRRFPQHCAVSSHSTAVSATTVTSRGQNGTWKPSLHR